MIDWDAMHKAIEQKNKANTRVEQLAGADIGFWATFHDLNKQKFKDLCESVLLDIRYTKRLEFKEEIMLRLGIEALQGAMYACSVEVKKAREPKRETIKRKV